MQFNFICTVMYKHRECNINDQAAAPTKIYSKHLSRQAAIAATFDMKKSFLILLQNQFGITDTDYLNNSFTMATDKNLKMSFTIIKLQTYFKQVIQKEI